ncbi:MAG TPA: hypothetical protein P5193_04485 [Microthrixaceae bacterium]|nr:hypothetical protein [Microthrixaceae bacterium]
MTRASDEREARLERGRRALRREGLADAAVRLVARRFPRGATLDEYARLLELDGDDIRAAVKRYRDPAPFTVEMIEARRQREKAAARAARTPPEPRSAGAGEFTCDHPGCDATYAHRRGLASHRLAAHTEPVPCPNGCGRLVNQRGIGPHLRFCPGPATGTDG